MSKLGILVEFLIACNDLIQRFIGLYHLSSEDATSEVATIRNEVDGSIKITLSLLKALAYLWHMLMAESLIDTHVAHTPRKMGCCSRLLTCTRATSNSINANVAIDEFHLCCRQQAKLNTCGKTTRVGNMHSRSYLCLIYFRKTIYEVVGCWSWLLSCNHSLRSKTEVLSQVDDFYILRHIVLLKESLALAMTEAEENDIYLIERHFGSKLQVGFAIETFVYIGNTIACIAFAICENYICFRMI